MPCHEAEFQSHSGSRHAQTLRDATLADLGPLAPAPDGKSLSVEEGRLVAEAPISAGTGVRRTPLQLALGSGKTGITFMALFDATSAEIRRSYFPKENAWYVTPGQDDAEPGRNGRIYTAEATRQCLSCHAVALPLESLAPERRFYGVGCESCHGAGAEHISAMQAGKPSRERAMESLKTLGGKAVNALCGRCHRTAEDVAGMGATATRNTVRFQPYGLSRSRCFKASEDKLTCITCHDPHADASTDLKTYERACLTCHSAGSGGKPCPVNPAEKCVGCHMPTRPIFTRSKIPIEMADHFIRIYPRKS